MTDPLAPDPKSSIARDSARLFLAQISGNAGFFVSVLIVARKLGPEGRGSMVFITVTALLIARMTKLGLSEATTVRAAQVPAERATLLSNLLVFSGLATLAGGSVVAGVLMAFPGLRPEEIGGLELAIMVGGAVAASLLDEAFLLGCRRMRHLSVCIATGGWASALAMVIAAVGPGLTVRSAAVAWGAAQLVVAAGQHLPVLLEFGLVRPGRRLLRECLAFGSRAWVGTLSARLNARMDQVLMGFIASHAALGIYTIAVNLSELMLYLPTAIASSLLPRVAGEGAQVAGTRTLRTFRMVMLVSLASTAIAPLVGPPVLPLLFGPDFEPSVTPFLWLVPGVLGYSAMSIFTNALLGVSSPGRSSLGSLVALLSGLVLDLLLIPPLGASGAAIAASAAFLVGGFTAMLMFRARVPFAWAALVPRGEDLRDLLLLPRQLLGR